MSDNKAASNASAIVHDPQNILEVKDLCKSYEVNKRKTTVLNGLDLTINEGEMVAVMGPSGSGKSTLLYTVSGMDKMSAGSVKFCGKEFHPGTSAFYLQNMNVCAENAFIRSMPASISSADTTLLWECGYLVTTQMPPVLVPAPTRFMLEASVPPRSITSL